MYLYLHDVEKLIPEMMTEHVGMLEVINIFNFVDIHTILESGLILLTVSCSNFYNHISKFEHHNKMF